MVNRLKIPQGLSTLLGDGSALIHCKKKDLLYKDITCLCHSLARLWVLCLVHLFLLGLGFAPSSVLDVSSVLCFAFVHRAVVFDGFVFRTWIGCSFFFSLFFMLLFRLFLRPFSFWFYCCRQIVVVLLIASDLGFPWGLLFYQVLFVVVLFILFFSMVLLFVSTWRGWVFLLDASFQALS